MTRNCLLTILLLWICGCQASRPEVQISPEQAKALNLQLTGGIAANAVGDLILTTGRGLKQYSPGSHQLTDLLHESTVDCQDVAVTSDNLVLALRSQSLCAVAAGYLIPVRSLPGRAYALSCEGGFAYILIEDGRGVQLVRYHLTGRAQGQIDAMLATQDRPVALCAVPGGCLVASGGNLIKVTDPSPDSDSPRGRVATGLLVAIQSPITSVVADQRRLIVYFSTKDTTYAWIKGQVIPIFPAGDCLAWAKDTLTICLATPANCQIIQLPAVSQHTEGLFSRYKVTISKQSPWGR